MIVYENVGICDECFQGCKTEPGGGDPGKLYILPLRGSGGTYKTNDYCHRCKTETDGALNECICLTEDAT
jgi:hypothetical protein